MIIAVDASGGDYAPQEIVKGAVEASAEYGLEVALLGSSEVIEGLLKQEYQTAMVSVVHARQAITCHEHPVQAVRSKPNSSIVKGVGLVKEKAADAFLSAGNTGAVLASSYLMLERLPGIERPAICVVVPVGTGGAFLLLDAGANADCQPRFLAQFAHLGSAFARLYLDIGNPRIGLLNNGEEEVKGSSLTKETYQLLKNSGLNFIGNVEGQDILKDRADVLVTDGFTGNVVLKTMEGFGDLLQNLFTLKKEAPGTASGNGQFSEMGRRMDFSEYGGSCLLGLKGNVIICHGRSKARAIKNAIRFAAQAAAKDMTETIMREMRPGTASI
ncbi:MAG: phosphate acyltransferase PlsX [Dehalococcoidia bacterium]|nr:phosphate acyltransferase PlsX [Dehalococcoidia bacterium]